MILARLPVRPLLAVFVALLLALPVGTVFASAAPAPSVNVPVLHAIALNGDSVTLPEDAGGGKVSVLVAGFSQGARSQVTDWGRRLAAEYRSSSTAVYYELPMIFGVPRLLRGWVIGKIRDSTPERARARIVPVADHEAEWKQAAGYDKADTAYVMVVDATGRVRWRCSGQLTDALFAEVKQQVQAASSR